MKNKFTARLLIFAVIVNGLLFSGTAFARSLTTDNWYLQNMTPHYILLSIGNHDGCPDISRCPAHRYKVSVSAEKARITLAKDFLIASDEFLTNSANDTAVPSDNLEFSFSTEFYKGIIFKMFPDNDATVDQKLTLKVTRDNETEQVLEIPYRLMSADSKSVLATAGEVDSTYAKWIPLSDWIRLKPLSMSNNLLPESIALNFKNKLEIIQRMLNLERYIRAQLLAGKSSNLTYMELQIAWDMVWSNIVFSNLDSAQFAVRYHKLKFLLERGKTSPALLVGNLKRLLTNMQFRFEQL